VFFVSAKSTKKRKELVFYPELGVFMEKLAWKLLRFFGKIGKKTFVAPQIDVEVKDVFKDTDEILDLGGGGEGVIGQLRGQQVVAIDLREDELKDAPAGPRKIVADARNLPFHDDTFEAVTAFFFFMYVKTEDHESVLKEAYRVLVPGGKLLIWDVTIPSHPKDSKTLFAVPVQAVLPRKTVNTAFGVRWNAHEMSADSLGTLAKKTGFVKESETPLREGFFLSFVKLPKIPKQPQTTKI
jgi:SAM-dependent methyltransferase